MKASDFWRQCSGRRFHVRRFGREEQVYGLGLQDVARCFTREKADMVAHALEERAIAEEIDQFTQAAKKAGLRSTLDDYLEAMTLLRGFRFEGDGLLVSRVRSVLAKVEELERRLKGIGQ